jgi:hypothetical protein
VGASEDASLSVIQTELFPATLWHSRAGTVACSRACQREVSTVPTFLAFRRHRHCRVASRVAVGAIRSNWLLVGFPGAHGWRRWDSPWAVFLQRRPTRVQLDDGGVEVTFEGPAKHFSMMPLYGAYKPPQKGQEVLSGLGLKEKGLLTWEWPTAVARDPLTRLRYWAGATRRFPVRCEDEVRVDRRRDEVVLRERFEWLEIPDEWGTAPLRIAPVSPTLGLALTKGQSFPVRFSRPPSDFGLATPYGPFFGVPDTDGTR